MLSLKVKGKSTTQWVYLNSSHASFQVILYHSVSSTMYLDIYLAGFISNQSDHILDDEEHHQEQGWLPLLYRIKRATIKDSH